MGWLRCTRSLDAWAGDDSLTGELAVQLGPAAEPVVVWLRELLGATHPAVRRRGIHRQAQQNRGENIPPLELYSRIAITDAQATYENVIDHFPV